MEIILRKVPLMAVLIEKVVLFVSCRLIENRLLSLESFKNEKTHLNEMGAMFTANQFWSCSDKIQRTSCDGRNLDSLVHFRRGAMMSAKESHLLGRSLRFCNIIGMSYSYISWRKVHL